MSGSYEAHFRVIANVGSTPHSRVKLVVQRNAAAVTKHGSTQPRGNMIGDSGRDTAVSPHGPEHEQERVPVAVKVLPNTSVSGLAKHVTKWVELRASVLRRLQHPNCLAVRELINDHEQGRFVTVMAYAAGGPIFTVSPHTGRCEIRVTAEMIGAFPQQQFPSGQPSPHNQRQTARSNSSTSATCATPLSGAAAVQRLFPESDLLLIKGELTARMSIEQVLSGVHYLHRNGLAHGALKPSNVLVTRAANVSDAPNGDVYHGQLNYGRIVLSDAGGGRWMLHPPPLIACPELKGAGDHRTDEEELLLRDSLRQHVISCMGACGYECAFLPPEAWKRLAPMDVKSKTPTAWAADAWAVGALAYCMLFEEVPPFPAEILLEGPSLGRGVPVAVSSPHALGLGDSGIDWIAQSLANEQAEELLELGHANVFQPRRPVTEKFREQSRATRELLNSLQAESVAERRRPLRERWNRILLRLFSARPHVTHEAQDFLQRALELDPYHRASIAELRIHPWIIGTSLSDPIPRHVVQMPVISVASPDVMPDTAPESSDSFTTVPTLTNATTNTTPTTTRRNAMGGSFMIATGGNSSGRRSPTSPSSASLGNGTHTVCKRHPQQLAPLHEDGCAPTVTGARGCVSSPSHVTSQASLPRSPSRGLSFSSSRVLPDLLYSDETDAVDVLSFKTSVLLTATPPRPPKPAGREHCGARLMGQSSCGGSPRGQRQHRPVAEVIQSLHRACRMAAMIQRWRGRARKWSAYRQSIDARGGIPLLTLERPPLQPIAPTCSAPMRGVGRVAPGAVTVLVAPCSMRLPPAPASVPLCTDRLLPFASFPLRDEQDTCFAPLEGLSLDIDTSARSFSTISSSSSSSSSIASAVSSLQHQPLASPPSRCPKYPRVPSTTLFNVTG